jgi:hypothetical protein
MTDGGPIQGERGEKGEPGLPGHIGLPGPQGEAPPELVDTLKQVGDAITELANSNTLLAREISARAHKDSWLLKASVALGVIVLIACGIGGYELVQVHSTQKSNQSIGQLASEALNPNSAFSKEEAKIENNAVLQLEGCLENHADRARQIADGTPVEKLRAGCDANGLVAGTPSPVTTPTTTSPPTSP